MNIQYIGSARISAAELRFKGHPRSSTTSSFTDRTWLPISVPHRTPSNIYCFVWFSVTYRVHPLGRHLLSYRTAAFV